MTDYHWHELRQRAIDLYGETPSAELEQACIDEFQRRPAHVANTIEVIGKKVLEGKIRSGWGILRKELAAPTGPNVTATDEAERDRKILRAKQWIDNAGVHFDRPDHIEAELFGDDYARGILTDYAHDSFLRADILAHWHNQRPRGEQAEADFQAWNAKCARDQAVVRELAKRQPANT